MTKDEALQMCLEALEGVLDNSPKVLDASISGGLYEVVQCRDAITAIKEALDECDEDELIIRYHEMTIKRLEKRIEELTVQPTSGDYALGYAEGFNDACKPKPAKEAVAWEQFHEHMAGSFYTHPPQRTWVGLTDEEIADCAEKMEASDPTDSFWREFFRGIEAKLKEKNT